MGRIPVSYTYYSMKPTYRLACVLVVLTVLSGCRTQPRSAPPAPEVESSPPAFAATASASPGFPQGAARVNGPQGWWAKEWTATVGDGFKGEPVSTTANAVLVRYSYYSVNYDLVRKIPVWAAYSVDRAAGDMADSGARAETQDPRFKRPSKFSTEPLVKQKSEAIGITPAKPEDYADAIDPRWPVSETITPQAAQANKAIIQRGHIVPNNAMKCTGDVDAGIRAQKESFSTANIAPQTNEHNAPVWSALEEAVLKWAQRFGRVWVVGGPVVTSNPPKRMVSRVAHQDRGIVSPDAFYYVVLVKDGNQLKAAGFMVPHGIATVNFRDAAYVKSVDQVEAVTGINFFPELGEPSTVEAMAGTWLANIP